MRILLSMVLKKTLEEKNRKKALKENKTLKEKNTHACERSLRDEDLVVFGLVVVLFHQAELAFFHHLTPVCVCVCVCV